MPACKHCGTVQATAQLRRSPKGGFICRDKRGCAHDRQVRAKGHEPGPRSLSSMFRF